MEKIKYYLVNSEILPDTYTRVVTAKKLLACGEAESASAAARMAGLSRSTYYKYKDAIFEYNGEDSGDTATVSAKLRDSAGVLSALMNELYKAGANVLSVNQSVPVDSAADVSVTFRTTDMTVSLDALSESIKSVSGVNAVKIM